MKKKFLVLTVAMGVMIASSIAAFAANDSKSINENKNVNSCCTSKAACCIQKAPCCK